MPEGLRLVAHPSPGGDRGHRPGVLGLGEDRLVAPDPLVSTAFLDHEPEVHPTPPEDVLDRLSRPAAAVRHAVAVEELGHLAEGVIRELRPDPTDDRRLLGYDDELPGMDEPTSRIAPAGVTQRIVAAMTTVFEQPSLEPGHPFRVEVPL